MAGQTPKHATEALAQLQLDEETGEMVSKRELKKRQQKRARKAATATTRAEKENTTLKQKLPPEEKTDDTQIDPDAMFKRGFLADVYNEFPAKHVVTRFPPEPNGFLHLGHAKAIALDFGFARYHGGKTLYDYAEQLIEFGKAYVCHCNDSEIKRQRGGHEGKEGPRYRCDHSEQDASTNLAKFRMMRDGKYEPQSAFLRMKQDISNPNPQMWDLAAYRIPKDQTPHHRTGNEWNIYPTYDFAHCLCDSLEGVTHSLCTSEFVLSRESYEWLNKSLKVYEPMQREFGRLNLNGTIMSKRGLSALVEDKIVRGWDDPRLYTLVALRRRGIPPGAILSFINELGVTTSRSFIEVNRFEQSVRKYLETTVPRLMLVLDPVAMVIEDLIDPGISERHIPSPTTGMNGYTQRLTQSIYIERSDFREADSKGYFRLAPGKTVGLIQSPYPVKVVGFSKSPTTGMVTEIRAVLDKDCKKPKAYIHWVPEGSRVVEVRVHSPLFKSDNPIQAEGGFRNDIRPDSETICHDALISSGFEEVRKTAPWPKVADNNEGNAPESVRFQAMRSGYFVGIMHFIQFVSNSACYAQTVDPDTTDDHVVLNRIVSLKEDSGKN
ncbi:glutaminyl-tRNA synthetase [Metarhizium acridum CQMa 102]|uniref:glutamine--tRNA ligase n=1 Tax=Metarhizium acridum (strain CQMa 102) TaxID=655827 RepID=E9EGB0_METAQ|nr:glutaminyl-tRNA synthetase [Metarhizium acridum CQMa 102]EFY85062.1 glutaminyl-tRNA synthetase [Metarhizium acridum CQMa 102]